MNISCEAIDKHGAQLDFDSGRSLDYDLAQFGTYVRTLRFLMKSNFQTIMYRMYRLGRADASLYKEALSMQAFNKEPNNLFGYIIKVVLAAPEGSVINHEPWRAIEHMLTAEEYEQALKKACQLWKGVLFIHDIISQTTDCARQSSKLIEQFKHANEFLINKMRSAGKTEIVALLTSTS